MNLFKRPEGTKNPHPALGIAIIVASFAIGGYFWTQSIEQLQKEKIAYLENLSGRLKSETVPVKFMIESREGGQVKARIKLYDLSGREVAAIERSWPGTQLYVDMVLFPFSQDKPDADKPDSWIALPYRIFTDELPAASGTPLFDAYDEGGFPGVLDGPSWSEKEGKTLKAAFAKARRQSARGFPAADSKDGTFGQAVHEAAKLASFEEGVVYKVVCRVKGGVEVLEE